MRINVNAKEAANLSRTVRAATTVAKRQLSGARNSRLEYGAGMVPCRVVKNHEFMVRWHQFRFVKQVKHNPKQMRYKT
jgi:hypothetical protein